MNGKARDLHLQSLQAREAGDYARSIDLNNQALFSYDIDGDDLGFAEALANLSITLRNYSQFHDSDRFLIYAKHVVMAGVEIAQKSGNKQALALPLYNLAKTQEGLGEIQDAVLSYKDAQENMQNNSPTGQNRPAVLADMKIHLAVAEYKSGDKSALQRVQDSLQELEQTQEDDKFSKNVWISGGYMKLADILRAEDAAKAKEYLQKAKKIIDDNPELTERKKQWKKLNQTFTS